MIYINRILFSLLISLVFFSCSTDQQEEKKLKGPKNIIILIADGMGYNHALATNYYTTGEAGSQVYEQDDWFHYGMATYNSIVSMENNDTVYTSGYSPESAWSNEHYLKNDFTDSAASATAISTGKKSYTKSIGMSVSGDTLRHISRLAKELGKSVGIVTSVPLSHATPAGFLTHNSSRDNYEEIAQSMLFNSVADVIMGTGNPNFDDNGNTSEKDYKYVGGKEVWQQLNQDNNKIEFNINDSLVIVNDVNGDGNPDAWKLIQARSDFINLIDNPKNRRILGVPQVYSTLRSEREALNNEELPFSTPINENIPALEEMTRAAIGVLSKNPEGFFIMIEGGAIDWAAHDNRSARMLEEHIDFNNSVNAAVNWVEQNSNWEETLMIVTSDHECGYLTGPSHPEDFNSPVKNMGKGNMPEMKWNFDHHTNQLVPFYAKGKGADLFEVFADEHDPVRGYYIQNSEIAQLIFLLWRNNN